MIKHIPLLVCLLILSPFVVADDVWFYLGPDKQYLEPRLKDAVALVKKQSECRKVTEATWGEAEKDIDMPNAKGVIFRVTCEVIDLQGGYENFWVAPDKLERSSIYRQSKRKFLVKKKVVEKGHPSFSNR